VSLRTTWLGGIALLSGLVSPLRAQAPRDSVEEWHERGPPDRFLTTTAGPQYRAGWLHRFLFGADYRRLWITPIRVEVLDLHAYAGGLRPIRRGGGPQTITLHFDAADGRRFAFRTINKYPGRMLRPELRGTLIEWVLKDQTSAAHPAGAVVVAPLLEAVGVRNAPPQLFVMPDDPSLGEFRREFAGVLGMLEERPTDETGERPGFDSARKVTHTEELFERLDRGDGTEVDARGFLAARLMDDFIGDWDRQPDQWQWIKQGKGREAPWLPIPYDRDQAFSRYEGLLAGAARLELPRVPITKFGDKYPDLFALNWNGRLLDQRLLAGLDWFVWDSVAHTLQRRLTDSVIDAAVARLPQPYYEKDGVRLARALKRRRDRLPDAARGFYRNLALAAEVPTTDASETITAVRGPTGTLDVTIRAKDADGSEIEPFHRQFDPRETKEVRLLMRGGDDTVHVVGSGAGPILRVIGGTGSKVVLDDGASARSRVYADSARVTVGGSHPPSIDRRPYTPDSTGLVRSTPRDVGHWWTIRPVTGGGSDAGLVLGAGVSLFDFGFRRNPYAFRLDLRAAYATGAKGFLFEVRGDRWFENSGTHFLFDARASEIDVLRFYGFGNETQASAATDFYRAYEHLYSFAPALGFSVGPRARIRLGPVLKYWTTDFGRATFISQVRPYGSGDFGQVGGEAAISFDSRDTIAAPTRGVHLTAGGGVYPGVWNVASTYGEVHGAVSTYLALPLPLEPLLALRAGGKRVWGDVPFQDAAFIGGGSTVRALYRDRYAGDASAYGNAELRFHLFDFRLPVPGQFGLLGLADAGRVWVTGESSSIWHHAFGGGIWFDYLHRRNTVSAVVARGDGRTGLYLRSGFAF
jgi:hypothetical protein